MTVTPASVFLVQIVLLSRNSQQYSPPISSHPNKKQTTKHTQKQANKQQKTKTKTKQKTKKKTTPN